MRCPLCHSANIKHSPEHSIKGSMLNHHWRSQYNIHIPAQDITGYQCHRCHLKFWDPITYKHDLIYPQLQQFDWYYPQSKSSWHLAKKHIQPNSTLLDVFCGQGNFKQHIPSSCTYHGLDQYSAPGVFTHTLVEHLLLYPQHYDHVVSFDSIEHVPDPYTFLQQLAQLVKPAGTLTLGIPADSSYLGRARDFALNMPPHHLTRWPDSTINHIAHIIGFDLDCIEDTPVEPDHALNYVLNYTPTRGHTRVITMTKPNE